MKHTAIALLFLPALCACSSATGWNARSVQIDEQLGTRASRVSDKAVPMDPSRAVRTADCTQPLDLKGGNLECQQAER
jgi:hypothetical protein